jgi:hypothetical protein
MVIIMGGFVGSGDIHFYPRGPKMKTHKMEPRADGEHYAFLKPIFDNGGAQLDVRIELDLIREYGVVKGRRIFSEQSSQLVEMGFVRRLTTKYGVGYAYAMTEAGKKAFRAERRIAAEELARAMGKGSEAVREFELALY